MARILTSESIVEDPWESWHEEEHLPDRWVPEHVGVRIIDAFRTLSMLPGPRGPKSFGTAWPAYQHEWSDLMAQAEAGSIKARQAERNRQGSKAQPSFVDVTRMEAALYWPAHYIADAWNDWRFAVNFCSMAFAFERDLDWVAGRKGGDCDLWRSRYLSGCDVIARGLIADRIAVF